MCRGWSSSCALRARRKRILRARRRRAWPRARTSVPALGKKDNFSIFNSNFKWKISFKKNAKFLIWKMHFRAKNRQILSKIVFKKSRNFAKFWKLRSREECKSCRSRKMLQNASSLAIVAVDTEENEPIKNEVWWVRRHFWGPRWPRRYSRRDGRRLWNEPIPTIPNDLRFLLLSFLFFQMLIFEISHTSV